MEQLPLATVIAREKRTKIRDRLKLIDPSAVCLTDFRIAVEAEGVHLVDDDYSYLKQLHSEGRFMRYVPALRHLKVLHTKDSNLFYIARQLESMSPDKLSNITISEYRTQDKPLQSLMSQCREEKIDTKKLEQIKRKLVKAESISEQLTPQICKSLIGLSLSDNIKETMFTYLEKANNKVNLERLSGLINQYKTFSADSNPSGRRRPSYNFESLKEAFSLDLKKRFASIHKAFIYFDLDNDGKISWNDFLTVSGYLSVATNEQELLSFFM